MFFSNIILLSCKNDDKEYIRIPDSSMKILSEERSKDSIVRRSQKIAYLKELAKLMKLHPMDRLPEGNLVRVWVWNWEADSIYVSDIHYGSKKNTFSLIQFGPFVKDSVQYILIHNKLSNIEPKLSWDSLLLSIKEYQITQLPIGKIHTGLTGMSPVQFETVESGIYHFYEFYEPAYYRMVDSNANKVYSFLNHLNKQAGINFYIVDSNFVYYKKEYSEPKSD